MKIVIEERDGIVFVTEYQNESVFPTTGYHTKRLAASRVLQILGIGPVAPQSHPEEICIGNIEEQP